MRFAGSGKLFAFVWQPLPKKESNCRLSIYYIGLTSGNYNLAVCDIFVDNNRAKFPIYILQ